MTEQEFRELSAGHALGALSSDDEHAYAAALDEHPEWVELAREDAETAMELGEWLPTVPPPAMLRAQILGAIAQTPQHGAPASPPPALQQDAAGQLDDTDPTLMESPAPQRKWRRTMFALVASVAVLAMIGIGTSSLLRSPSQSVEAAALQQIESAPDATSATASFAGGKATAHWSESAGKVVIVADGLPQLDDERTFELWFVRGETPLSAGTFTSDDGSGTALLVGTMEPGDLIAVTVEEAGGSPTGLPTTEPILAIATA